MRYDMNSSPSWWLAIVFAVSTTALADVPKIIDAFPLKLNVKNYETWRDHILPENTELDFQKIPWLTTFKDGVLTANGENLPLLFWTMNGHPLGCT